jgi:hypothetical protein
MKISDLQTMTWYATRERHGFPDPVLVLGPRRFSRQRVHNQDVGYTTVLKETPEARMGGGGRESTGILAISLHGQVRAEVRRWVEDGQPEDAKPDCLDQAAWLMARAVERVRESKGANWDEVSAMVYDAGEPDENGMRPFRIGLVQPRQLNREYAEDILARNEESRRRQEENAKIKAVRDRQAAFYAETVKLAEKLGLNEGILRSFTHGKTEVRVQVGDFRRMLEEIERLRTTLAETLRADETGESGH